MHYGSACYSKL